MPTSVALEIAATAAPWVVDEGMDYASAKRKAAQQLAGQVGKRPELPSNEQLEDAVREHIALFCADTQPAELLALRRVALLWLRRLAAFRPHVAGAVWRGTATRLSAVHIDLYCDDAKAAEFALIDAGQTYDVGELPAGASPSGNLRREPIPVLSLASPCPELGEPATVHLVLHDADEQRGALKPDSQGRSWRGDGAALQRLIEAQP
jgi:hypothetical protein